ncbi:MAG: hypothetical protein Q9171_004441 [Xanthocarpia ochracea]
MGSLGDLLYGSLLVLLLVPSLVNAIATHIALRDIVRLLQNNIKFLQRAPKSSPQTDLPYFMPAAVGGEYSETSQWIGPPYKHYNSYILRYRDKTNIRKDVAETLAGTSPAEEAEAPVAQNPTPRNHKSGFGNADLNPPAVFHADEGRRDPNQEMPQACTKKGKKAEDVSSDSSREPFSSEEGSVNLERSTSKSGKHNSKASKSKKKICKSRESKAKAKAKANGGGKRRDLNPVPGDGETQDKTVQEEPPLEAPAPDQDSDPAQEVPPAAQEDADRFAAGALVAIEENAIQDQGKDGGGRDHRNHRKRGKGRNRKDRRNRKNRKNCKGSLDEHVDDVLDSLL